MALTLLALSPLTVAACSKKSGNAKDEAVPFDTRPLPALAPALPVPSGDHKAFAEKLAQTLQDTTRAEPALVTAFALLDLPVSTHEGKLAPVAGASPRGVPTPAWVVQFLATNAQRAPAVNLGQLFAALSAHPDLKGMDLGPLVLRDWARAFHASERGRADAAAVLLRLGAPTGPSMSDTLANARPEQINVSALQAQLLLRRLAQEIVLTGGGTASSAHPAPRRIAVKDGQSSPCSMSHDQEMVEGVGSSGYSKIFNEVLEKLREKGIISPGSNLESNREVGSFIVDLANYVLLLAALHVDASIDRPPLVRTHDKQAGELRTVTAHVYFDAGRAAMVNCWRLAFASVGMSGLEVPENGPLANVKVSFRGRQGTSEVEFDPTVRFTGPTDAKTNDDGKASVNVEGRPQRRKIPDSAPPVDKTATVSIQVIPTDTSFFSDLEKLFKLALAKGEVSPSLGIEMLKRMNPVPFLYDIAVRDWQDGRRFTLNGSYRWSHDPINDGNPLDSDGNVSFTGEMGCLPSDTGTRTWICAGDLTLKGSGTTYFLDPVIKTAACVYGWHARGLVLTFSGSTTGAVLDMVGLRLDPNSPAQPDNDYATCKRATLTLVLPIDDRAIGHPLELPAPGKGLQGDLPLSFDNGTVSLTILSAD
jgi:hypothetical protein